MTGCGRLQPVEGASDISVTIRSRVPVHLRLRTRPTDSEPANRFSCNGTFPVSPDGQRLCASTKTEDRKEAEAYIVKLKLDAHRQTHLGIKPARFWCEAAVRYLELKVEVACDGGPLREVRNGESFRCRRAD
jgi:hypothetical protein